MRQFVLRFRNSLLLYSWRWKRSDLWKSWQRWKRSRRELKKYSRDMRMRKEGWRKKRKDTGESTALTRLNSQPRRMKTEGTDIHFYLSLHKLKDKLIRLYIFLMWWTV